MGVIGPEYEFLFADVGMNGRMSDGGNWSRNEFQKEKNPPDENNPLSIPNPKPLPGRSKPIPYVCVGDDAFPLTSFMMKPYPQTGLTEEKESLITDFLDVDAYQKMVLEFWQIDGEFLDHLYLWPQRKLRTWY